MRKDWLIFTDEIGRVHAINPQNICRIVINRKDNEVYFYMNDGNTHGFNLSDVPLNPLIEHWSAHTETSTDKKSDDVLFVDDLYCLSPSDRLSPPTSLPSSGQQPRLASLSRPCWVTSLRPVTKGVAALLLPVVTLMFVLWWEFEWLKQAQVTAREIISLLLLIAAGMISWKLIKEVTK